MKSPDKLEEYMTMAEEEGIPVEQYVWENEGTLNRKNGHFLCTQCYINAGMPTSPQGWTCP